MKVEIDSFHTLTVEQNIGSVLKHLASSQSTGCLEVTGGNTKWLVFIHLGELLRIDCSVRSLGQLIYRLCQLSCDEAAQAVNTKASGSNYLAGKNIIQQEIDRLVAQEVLDPTVGMQFSIELMKEVLESLLWLQAGSYRWRKDTLNPTELAIDRAEARLDLAALIDYYQHRLTIWQNYTNIVQSPHQRPYLMQKKLLDKPVVAGTLSSKALRQIAQLMQGITLRELSLLLKQDELRVVQILTPYLREKIVCLREPSALLQQLPPIPELNLLRIPDSGELVSLDREVDKIWAMKQGVKVYLTKPYTAEDLLAAVREVIG